MKNSKDILVVPWELNEFSLQLDTKFNMKSSIGSIKEKSSLKIKNEFNRIRRGAICLSEEEKINICFESIEYDTDDDEELEDESEEDIFFIMDKETRLEKEIEFNQEYPLYQQVLLSNKEDYMTELFNESISMITMDTNTTSHIEFQNHKDCQSKIIYDMFYETSNIHPYDKMNSTYFDFDCVRTCLYKQQGDLFDCYGCFQSNIYLNYKHPTFVQNPSIKLYDQKHKLSFFLKSMIKKLKFQLNRKLTF